MSLINPRILLDRELMRLALDPCRLSPQNAQEHGTGSYQLRALALTIFTSSHDIYQRLTTAIIEYDTGIELSGD